MPPDLAVLLVGIAARQATSPTARVEAMLENAAAAVTDVLPKRGAFDAATARLIADSKAEWCEGQE